MSVFGRDAARGLLVMLAPSASLTLIDQYLDALEGCVRPAPAQTIDRDALIAAIKQGLRDPSGRGESGDLYGAVADRILALLRPVDDVTLTPEEAATAATALRSETAWTIIPTRWRVLAERLEAASGV